jgi:hypothetical protein
MVMETISRSGTNFSSKGRRVWGRGVIRSFSLEEDISNEKLGVVLFFWIVIVALFALIDFVLSCNAHRDKTSIMRCK